LNQSDLELLRNLQTTGSENVVNQFNAKQCANLCDQKMVKIKALENRKERLHHHVINIIL